MRLVQQCVAAPTHTFVTDDVSHVRGKALAVGRSVSESVKPANDDAPRRYDRRRSVCVCVCVCTRRQLSVYDDIK